MCASYAHVIIIITWYTTHGHSCNIDVYYGTRRKIGAGKACDSHIVRFLFLFSFFGNQRLRPPACVYLLRAAIRRPRLSSRP